MDVAADGSCDAVEPVIAGMRRCDGGPLSLDDMAGIAHLSPFHLSRVSKRVTGVSPGAFMSALRMERAKRLLLTTEMSVSEICFETGYESLGTFTARFTQLVGVSPGRLRRLPERLPETLGRFPEERSPTAGGVTFRVSGLDLDGALIFAGLFPTAIPQGRPVACVVLDGPGTCRIPSVPDGVYFLLVAALPRSGDPMKSLLLGRDLRVGTTSESLGPGADEQKVWSAETGEAAAISLSEVAAVLLRSATPQP